MAKGLFKRIGNTAVPATPSGREALLSVKDGATFVAEVTAPKNQEQVNLFFALRDLVCEATDATRIAAKRWLLEQTKCCDLIFLPDGTMRIEVWSIAGMSQDVFDQFFQASLPIIQEALGVSHPDLLARYFDLLDPQTRAAARKRLRKVTSPATAPAAESDQPQERADEAELAMVGRGRQ